MTTLRTIFGATWLGGAWGLLSGTLLGTAYGALFANVLLLFGLLAQDPSQFRLDDIPRAIFGMLFFALIGSVMGALFGVPTGFVVGVIDGLLIGILTRAFFFPLHDAARHRRVVGIASAIFTAIASYICFVSIMLFYANRAQANVPVLMLIAVIPALVAGAAGWFVAKQIARWYQHSSNTPSGSLGAPSPSVSNDGKVAKN